MKVLLVSPLPPPVGGIASWTVNLLEYIKQNSDHVDLLHVNSAVKGISITNVSKFKRFIFGISNSFRIYNLVRKSIVINKPCVIHLTTSSSLALFKDYFLIKLAEKWKIPVVVHWRFGRIPFLASQCNWEWNLLKALIKRSSLSIVIDSKSYKTLFEAGFRNLVNIPNPLGITVEQKSRDLLGKSLNKQRGQLIYVGHIIKSKGIYELVEACSYLPQIKKLILIGPSEKEVIKELRTLADRRENGVWLKLIGELTKGQVLEYMSRTPVLVLPSLSEGFPNTVLEGMAMGCAIVATDVGAIPEMIDIHGSNPCGICVPPQHAERLKEAILELFQKPSKAENMGKNGIERVLKNYTMKEIVEQYLNIWKKLANNKIIY